MTHLPLISALTPEQLTEYKSRVAAWLASDQSDLAEGVTLCTAIPQAALFVSYHQAYTPCTRRKHILQFLSTIDTTPVEATADESADTTSDTPADTTVPDGSPSGSDTTDDAAPTSEDGVSTPSSSTDSENSEDTTETKKRR